MNIRRMALRGLKKLIWKPDPDPDPQPRKPSVENRFLNQFTSEDELQQLRRKNREYFEIIERVLAERDGWQRRYREHVREHLVAQQIYERNLVKARKAAGVLLNQLNALRQKHDLPPVKLQRPEDIEPLFGAPIGEFEGQLQKHIRQLEKLDGAFDALEARGESSPPSS